jgi:mannose/fructose/N-acetylgalactosamine-specific phosphotransferase system component IIC
VSEAGSNEAAPNGSHEAAPNGSRETVDEGAQEAAQEEQLTNSLAVASVALSALGFLTLLRLADRRERTPFRALGLFCATTLESISGTVLGLVAAKRGKETGRTGRGFLIAAAGTVLGVITTILNFNWMRTRRKV